VGRRGIHRLIGTATHDPVLSAQLRLGDLVADALPRQRTNIELDLLSARGAPRSISDAWLIRRSSSRDRAAHDQRGRRIR
jgi:hypothetical protein